LSDRIPLFRFIASDHPFAPQVERFRRAIAAHPRHAELTAAARAGRATIHAEIKALPEPGETWRLDRFYWSLQTWDGPAPLPFRASTLSFAAKNAALEWYEFPADAYLTTMADYFEAARARPDEPIDVLRYVPLRRFTFLTRDAAGVPIIAKFKRRSRFQSAYDLLGTVFEALRPERVGFSVSAPAGLDAQRCLYFQSALPGTNLVELLTPGNLASLLGRVGSLHRALHETPVERAPGWDREAFMAGLRRDLAWIGFMLPQHRARLGELLAAVEAVAAEAIGRARAFCHGDFVCSQILAAGDAWSVTDFDLCHNGDPYRDIAIFLASLAYDVPLLERDAGGPSGAALAQQAAAAYLAGYEERAGERLDARSLLCHRVCAEIYYLGLMLKKDRYDPIAFERRVGAASRLARSLRSSRPERAS
jgi:aminoglycoside phosphotransferase